MKRLLAAPNLALATLWADQLSGAGIAASVQRIWAGSIAGEIPVDQALPNPPWRRWACRGCGEIVEGPFEQCWNCGAARAD